MVFFNTTLILGLCVFFLKSKDEFYVQAVGERSYLRSKESSNEVTGNKFDLMPTAKVPAKDLMFTTMKSAKVRSQRKTLDTLVSYAYKYESGTTTSDWCVEADQEDCILEEIGNVYPPLKYQGVDGRMWKSCEDRNDFGHNIKCTYRSEYDPLCNIMGCACKGDTFKLFRCSEVEGYTNPNPNYDDPAYNMWGIEGRGCEWIRERVDNPDYHDEDNNFLQSKCVTANLGKKGLCPSCESGDIADACPSVCRKDSDDQTFRFWGAADKDCEMVRATVTNTTLHDDNGDFNRTKCMEAYSNKGSYCPSCEFGGPRQACPSVCQKESDDPTFRFWGAGDHDCEMVRATINNQTLHDENGDFLRKNCMEAYSNKGSYCPSCEFGGVSKACPSVCKYSLASSGLTSPPTPSPPPTPKMYLTSF